MKQLWLKRAAAWLLAALMLVSPALADAVEEPIPAIAAVDAVVAECGDMDLPEDLPADGAAQDADTALTPTDEGAPAPEGEAQTAFEGGDATNPPEEENPTPAAEGGDTPDPAETGNPAPAAERGDTPEPAENPAPAAEENPAPDAPSSPAAEGENESSEQPEVKSPEGEEGASSGEAEGAEKAEGDDAEKAEGEDAEKAEGDDAEKAEGDDAEKAEDDDAEKAEGDDTDKAKGEGTEKAEGDDAEKAEGEDAEKAEGEGAEKAEGEGADKAEGEDAEAKEADKAEGSAEGGAEAAQQAAAQAETVAAPEAEAAKAPEAEATASGIALPEPEVIMGKGEKRVLTPVVNLEGEVALTWASSNPKVVSVSQKGKLNARRLGSAVITLSTADGLTASCQVRVFRAPSRVRVLPGKKATLGVGETFRLSGKLPKGTGSGLKWSSRNPAVAVVAPDGSVTGIAPGKAKIVVRTFNGKKAACKVTVKAAPSSLAFPAGDQTLGVGMSVDVKPVVNPGAAANATVISDNPGVVSVNGTVVTAVAPGTAVLAATTYNGLTATAAVTVLPAPGAVSLNYAVMHMGVGEKLTLTPSVDPGTATSFRFKTSNKRIVGVSAKGVVKAKKRGTATITVIAHNGVRAKVRVKVYKAPSKVKLKPSSLAMEVGGSAQLSVKLSRGSASTITFTSSNPDVVTVDGNGALCAIQPGSARITARTYNKKKAVCKVTVISYNGTGAPDGSGPVSLSNSGMVMMKLGANWALNASAAAKLTWSTSASGIARIKANGNACTVTAVKPGTAIVSASQPDGASASVIIMAVDTADLSTANFVAVQKALLAHEYLVNSPMGGNVIWEMIAAKMRKCNYPSARIDTIVNALKSADPTYRDLYIYTFGAYNQQAEAASQSASNYNSTVNTLYIAPSSKYSTDLQYLAVVFHETGHALDFLADGNNAPNSRNADVENLLRADVRDFLNAGVGDAMSLAGVNLDEAGIGRVLDTLMDYRVLNDPSIVTSTLSPEEQAVYNQMAGRNTGVSAREMVKAALPRNNGCMVWDAVEGVTNFAISGAFGHGYLLDSSTYGDTAKTYYYDVLGNAKFTTEPWAEFFSSNLLGDDKTLSANWQYLPKTCKYFAETFVPGLVNYFTTRIKNL